ncbi:MAG: TRAP transporter large permease subunit [Betaproteobacteria bacterium]|nr:TRAP transporter large permease subunit [Betaproteobacteria bacterium]MBI2960831.1 TRAP transporter large permease subunit [Betaproteobacteria bacterium]
MSGDPAGAAVPGEPRIESSISGTLSRAVDAAVTGLNALGSLWVFVMMAMIVSDVSARFFFNSPIKGVPLLIELSIVAIVFLQLASVLRAGRLTRSEIMIGKLLARKPAMGAVVESCYYAAGAFLMALIFIHNWPLFEAAWAQRTYVGVEGYFSVPVWPLKLLILVGSAICGIQFLRGALGDFRTLRQEFLLVPSSRRDAALGAAALAGAIFLMYLALTYAASSPGLVGLISVLFVCVTVYAGVHIGVALALLSFFCLAAIRGDFEVSGKLLALAAGTSLQRYDFGVIPLFVLMGVFVTISDIGKDTYEVANTLFRRVRGGLGMATVGANAVFAAVTGSSIASASVFTKISIPEMLRHSYRPRFAVGVVAGSSVLGMLIPPSLLLIIYGILAETSIGALFLAGIVPGIILSAAYCLLIWFMAKQFPNFVAMPEGFADRAMNKMPVTELLGKTLPIVVLIGAVLGGIYGGVFTATEAGGIGAFLAFALTIIRRKLTWGNLWHALKETGHVSAAICFLLIAAHVYSRMIAITGIPNAMEHYLQGAGMGLGSLIAIYLIVILILGTILDAGSIMLITVPLMVAAVAPFQVNMIWLGIITVVAIEVGLLTPPFGLSCFVIHNNLGDARISLEDVFWGAAPFAGVMVIVLGLLTAFPRLSLLFA